MVERRLRANLAATSSTPAIDISITEYHEALLEFSRTLIDQRKYGISTVVAHMACEIVVERVFASAFETKKISELQEPVTELFSGYNLSNPRIRKVYAALTGDSTIQDEPFWTKFKTSATRRNHIMHKRHIATKQEAEESLGAASALIAYLDQKFRTS